MGILTLRGTVWDQPGSAVAAQQVLVGAEGVILAVENCTPSTVDEVADPSVIAGVWVGPALIDAHVHLAFGSPELLLTKAVGAVRDLGAPLASAQAWRAGPPHPVVAVTGELLTAADGYPMNGWGAEGFSWPVSDPGDAAAAVRRLVEAGADLIKLALEPAAAQPVPDLATCRAVVDTAHAAGLAVTCHALATEMIVRGLDAGVDEFCHTPTEVLPDELVDRLAAAGVTVISTIQTLIDGGAGGAVLDNARTLVAAGVPLLYGTDLGNAGTTPGVSVTELEQLAAAGLGRTGALHAATTQAARLPGLAGRVDVAVRPGARTVLVVLDADPLVDPTAWHRPVAVVAGGRLIAGSAHSGPVLPHGHTGTR